MRFDKSLCVLLSFCVAMLYAGADDIWLPGQQYAVQINYGFVSSNVHVKAAPNFDWHGELVAKEICFKPIVEYVTSCVTNFGTYCMAYRDYRSARNFFTGASKSDWDWKIDDDVNCKWMQELKNYWKRDKNISMAWKDLDDARDEPFSPFDDVGFDVDKDVLLLRWEKDGGLDDGKRINACRPIKGKDDLSARGYNWNPIPEREIFGDAVSSECSLLYSSMFGHLGLKGDAEWSIDASQLNGLLCGKNLKDAITFDGTLFVRKSTLRKSDFKIKNEVGTSCKLPNRFSGVKLDVINSEGLTLRYRKGPRYNVHVASDADSHMEFWFDGIEQTMRYANIVVRIKNYKGEAPNPRLGHFTSTFKGTIDGGDFIFTCEYRCNVSKEGL